jgi:glycosyltransferase involved in cell wall biosynthesis
MTAGTDQALHIVLFCHPEFLGSQSMPRFANMLVEAYERAGYRVSQWAPKARLHRLARGSRALAKWAGYIDQYILFPLEVRWRMLAQGPLTLYVFCDQALGPWVPLVKHKPHVVHAHDLLALRSALGLIPENPTSRSGQLYQKYIRRGFKQGRAFICISERTKSDLQAYGGIPAQHCDVVYNGLNFPYQPMSADAAIAELQRSGLPATAEGMLLHVGGNQWYKNTEGLVHLYAQYAGRHAKPLPLWLISPPPNESIRAALATVPPQGQVRFFQGLSNLSLQAAYSHARAFLFPSLAEGFGWPIVEALACACPVITTDDAPMTEVGGQAAYYLPRRQHGQDVGNWARSGADLLEQVLAASPQEQSQRRQIGLQWASLFQAEHTINTYLRVYERVLAQSTSKG